MDIDTKTTYQTHAYIRRNDKVRVIVSSGGTSNWFTLAETLPEGERQLTVFASRETLLKLADRIHNEFRKNEAEIEEAA